MAVQINLSDVKSHVGKKVKIFCKILSSHSANEFVVADKTDYKLLLANEEFSNKHLQIGNFIKILNPEILIHEEKVVIRIGEKTSILSSPKIDGVVTPPEDHLLMKSVKEPATSLKSPKIKTTDELENSLKIASTFGMEKCQVVFLLGTHS